MGDASDGIPSLEARTAVIDFINRLAREHSVKVEFNAAIGAAGAQALVRPDKTIVLDPDLYPPRMAFRFCHELAHILLDHSGPALSKSDEYEADKLAGELLLPESDFKRAIRKYDLEGLKEQFPHASWEAIGRRYIQFIESVLTIWDNGKQTTRVGSPGFGFPPAPENVESAVMKRCLERGEHIAEKVGRFDMSAWFVDEGRGVKRVLMLTKVEEF